MNILTHYNDLHEYIQENYCNLNYDIEYLVEETLLSVAKIKNLNSLLKNYIAQDYVDIFINLVDFYFVYRLNVSKSKTIMKIHETLPKLTKIFNDFAQDTPGSNPGRIKSFIKHPEEVKQLYKLKSKGRIRSTPLQVGAMTSIWNPNIKRYEKINRYVNMLSTLYRNDIPDIKGNEYTKEEKFTKELESKYKNALNINSDKDVVLPSIDNELWINYIKSFLNFYFITRGRDQRELNNVFKSINVMPYLDQDPNTKENIAFSRFYKKFSEQELNDKFDKFLSKLRNIVDGFKKYITRDEETKIKLPRKQLP